MPTVDTDQWKLKPTIVNTFIKNELSFSNIVICQLIITIILPHTNLPQLPNHANPSSLHCNSIVVIFSNHSGKEKAHHRNKPASASFANTRRSHTKRPNAKSGKSRLCRTHTHTITHPHLGFFEHTMSGKLGDQRQWRDDTNIDTKAPVFEIGVNRGQNHFRPICRQQISQKKYISPMAWKS